MQRSDNCKFPRWPWICFRINCVGFLIGGHVLPSVASCSEELETNEDRWLQLWFYLLKSDSIKIAPSSVALIPGRLRVKSAPERSFYFL